MIVSSNLQQQIDWLHKEVGKKEWSGCLVYETISGDLNNPNDLVFRAKGVFLMDVGTAGGTDFEVTGQDTFDLTEYYPSLMEGDSRIGLIHTHHNMGISFSGVDKDELKQNSEDYNAYLSLIVGFDLKYKARVAFVTEVKEEKNKIYNFKNMEDQSFESVNSEEDTNKIISFFDCDIVMETPNIDEEFIERFDEVKERSKQRRKTVKKVGFKHSHGGYSSKHYPKKATKGYSKDKTQTKSEEETRKVDQTRTFKYENGEIEEFLCKVASYNPKSNAVNLEGMLTTLDRSNKTIKYLTPKGVVNIIDECFSETFPDKDAEEMTADDRLELIIESIDYLEFPYNGDKPYADKYDTARAVLDCLEDIFENLMKNEKDGQQSIRF